VFTEPGVAVATGAAVTAAVKGVGVNKTVGLGVVVETGDNLGVGAGVEMTIILVGLGRLVGGGVFLGVGSLR
jgi:hypothetical protein